MSSLTVKDLTKSFAATPVLTGVDLHVPSGSLTALLGPSGCGKTTLLRLIAGFDDPDSGTVTVGGREVAGARGSVAARRRGIGFVPQEGGLFPHLSVARNIGFGLSRRQRRDGARVRELLDLVGLDAGLGERAPHQLSGGQQQRVALARALAPEPSLVLLDEPFSSLDASLRDETRVAVASALAAIGATAVLVTHDQAEALSLAGEVAVMRDGRIVQVDAPDRVYGCPVDPEVAAFVGESVVLPADVADGVATCALGRLALATADRPLPGGATRVLIRPEQIAIGSGDGVPAEVTEVSYFGHDAAVRLVLDDGGATVLARVIGAGAPHPGDRVALAVRGPVIAYADAGVV
jgi:iron(III) transport system ATP-binding protein